MASKPVCSLFHILTSKSSAPEIKDHPLQTLPCRCDNEADFRPIKEYEAIVRCEDERIGSYQLGLRFIDLGTAWTGDQLEARRFHILAGAILERPAFLTSPAHVLEASELRPFGSPNQYLKLDFRRPAILHAALIPSFNLDILAAVINAKSKGLRESDRHERPEFANACWLMSQFVRIFENLMSSDCSDLQGDKLAGVDEDLTREVKLELGWPKTTSVDKRSHKFLSNTTRCKSDYHHSTWYSLDGKFCWIDAPIDREETWEMTSVVRMKYKPPTNCHTGRLFVTARAANVDIKHPISRAIHGGQTVGLRTDLGVRLRVSNVITINFRSYTRDSQPAQAGIGKLPSDTSGLSALS